jgi:hypothetical protein
MTATVININSVTNKYKIAKGIVMFNQLLNGEYQGFRRIGNCPTFALTIATTSITHDSSEGGLAQQDFDEVAKITRSGKLTCDNLNIENQNLFLSATTETVTQAATPITDYNIPLAIGDRTYQLGAATGNLTGVRGVSSIAVRVQQGAAAATRANTTAYAKGAFIIPATPNNHYYVATVGGTSGGSIPTYPTNGTTVADGGVTWKDMGLIIVPSTTDVNYRIDTDLGLLSVTPAGTIAVASAFVASLGVTGLDGIGLNVDYTPAANTRTRIKTSNTAQLTGQLKFLAVNPFGDQQDVFIPSAAIKPSGDMPFVGTDITAVNFDIGINKLDSDTEEVYIDSRAA